MKTKLFKQSLSDYNKLSKPEWKVHQKYLVAKMCFQKVQRLKDASWSTDTLVNGFGEILGWRLNNNFWKRPEVKRQLQAAKRSTQ